MSFDFSQRAADEAILNTIEAEGAGGAKVAATLLNRQRRIAKGSMILAMAGKLKMQLLGTCIL